MLKNDISVILNVYKRPHMLERQIEAVLDQSVPVHPTNIHVWYNESGVVQMPPEDVRVNTYVCNWNTKFFGRFLLPLLCKTDYIAIFDDDLLPGERWFENCLDVINTEETNGILGGVGVIVGDGGEKTRVGWYSPREGITKVDFIGQAWFFRKEWAKYMWYEEPYSWDNAEDIMFCYQAQKYGGIDTFVPSYPQNDKSMWCTSTEVSWAVGRDRNASWRNKGHGAIRRQVIAHCKKNGWKTINNI